MLQPPLGHRVHGAIYGALIVAALAILFDQAVELAVQYYPYRLGEAPWRFAAFGLAMTKATPVIFADALFAVATLGLRSRLGLRVWAATHLLGLVALALALTLFGLDYLELRRAIRPEARTAFTITASRAGLVASALGSVWLWAAVAGLRGTRKPKDPKGAPDLPVFARARHASLPVDSSPIWSASPWWPSPRLSR